MRILSQSQPTTSELRKIIHRSKQNYSNVKLVRFPEVEDGQFFTNYLKKPRNILGPIRSLFLFPLISMKNEKLCGDHFLPKLQNMRGDPNFLDYTQTWMVLVSF